MLHAASNCKIVNKFYLYILLTYLKHSILSAECPGDCEQCIYSTITNTIVCAVNQCQAGYVRLENGICFRKNPTLNHK